MGQKEDPYNYLLMPAISANVGGQIGSVVAGGIILTLVPLLAWYMFFWEHKQMSITMCLNLKNIIWLQH